MLMLAFAPARANTLAVVATAPEQGATGVAMQTTLSFTFNQAVEVDEVADFFLVEPSSAIDFGEPSVSVDGRQVTFDVTHLAETDFLWIISGGYEDALSGATTGLEPFVLRYTTAATAGTASVTGTISVDQNLDEGRVIGRRRDGGIAVPMSAPLFKEMQRSQKERIKTGSPSDGQGIPTSQFKNPDPSGTVVVLSTVDPFSSEDEEIAGAAVVFNIEGVYEVPRLRPGTYYPYAMKIGIVDEEGTIGDWLGSIYFGFYDPDEDGNPDAITVPETGTVQKIDFKIAALSSYAGTASELENAAREVADIYASDQQLVGMQTGFVNTSGKSPVWTYTYHSSSTDMLTDVTVTPFDFEIELGAYENPLPPVVLPVPFYDSDAALSTALINGGEEFLNRNPAAFVNVNAGLRIDPSAGPDTDDPFWAVSFVTLSPTRIDYLIVFLDFETGAYLGSERTEQAPGKYSDRYEEALAELAALEGNFTLVGLYGENVAVNGVADEWQFDFYAEDTDTRAIVVVGEGHSGLESERPAGHPDVTSLGDFLVDSDYAIEAAMIYGGADFVTQHGAYRIVIEAGDMTATYPHVETVPTYVVSILALDGAGDVWVRAFLDPCTSQMVHV